MAKYNMKDYVPYKLKQRDEKDLRKEYSKIRKQLMRRARSLRGTEHEQSEFYKRYKAGYYPSLRDIDKHGLDVTKELSDLVRQINRVSETTKRGLSRQMKGRIEAYRENYGWNFINEKNYYNFQQYLDRLRETYGNAFYGDSDRAAELYEQAERLKIRTNTLIKHYDEFAANVKLIEKMETPKGRGVTLAQLRNFEYKDSRSGRPVMWEDT